MLPACRTEGEGFAIPTFEVVPSDVEGFIDELWECQAAFHVCEEIQTETLPVFLLVKPSVNRHTMRPDKLWLFWSGAFQESNPYI